MYNKFFKSAKVHKTHLKYLSIEKEQKGGVGTSSYHFPEETYI